MASWLRPVGVDSTRRAFLLFVYLDSVPLGLPPSFPFSRAVRFLAFDVDLPPIRPIAEK